MTSKRLAVAAALVTAVAGPGVAEASAATRNIDATAVLRTTIVHKDGSFVQRGSVNVAPIGSGSMVLTVRVVHGRAFGSFSVILRRGLVRGSAAGPLVFRGSRAYVTGSAGVTGGTKAYRSARGSNLRFSATAPANLSSSRVRLRGRIRY